MSRDRSPTEVTVAALTVRWRANGIKRKWILSLSRFPAACRISLSISSLEVSLAASGCLSFNLFLAVLLKTGEILPGNQHENDFASGLLVRFHTALTSPTGISPSADPVVMLFAPNLCRRKSTMQRALLPRPAKVHFLLQHVQTELTRCGGRTFRLLFLLLLLPLLLSNRS